MHALRCSDRVMVRGVLELQLYKKMLEFNKGDTDTLTLGIRQAQYDSRAIICSVIVYHTVSSDTATADSMALNAVQCNVPPDNVGHVF